MTAIQNDINLEHIEADYGRRIMQEFHTTLYPAEGVQYRGKERDSDPPPAQDVVYVDLSWLDTHDSGQSPLLIHHHHAFFHT